MKKLFQTFLLSLLNISLALAIKQINIGVVLPMTGPISAFGQQTWKGMKLAHEIEPTVKINGEKYKINLILMDNRGDKAESANAAARLITEKKVKVILGAVASSNSIAMSEVAEKNKTPMVSPSSTNPLVTQGKKYVFRVCFIDPFQGYVAAKFARNYLRAKTAAVLIDLAQDYSVGLAKSFMKSFRKLGGRIIYVGYYRSGDKDFKALLTRLKYMYPDVIYVPGYYQEAALIARQAKELGVKSKFLAGDGVESPKLVEIGGKAVEGLYFTTHFDEKSISTKLGKEFVKKFHQVYKRDLDSLAALGADAYFVVVDAIKRAGSLNKKAIRDAIANTKNFPGVTGYITIDKYGNAVKPAVIKKVKNGKFVYVTTINP